jgi:hypothetical protein
MANTPVVVRAQALGGKFLGKAVCGSPPALVVKLNGQQVAAGTFTTANSGMEVPASGPGPGIITVDPNPNPQVYKPGYYAVQPGSPDSALTVQLPLTAAPQTFEFIVTAYNGDQTTTTATVFVQLSAGSAPAVTVPVAGLRITNASAVASGGTVVTASVAMMCGCMITPIHAQPAEPYWPETEFVVAANGAPMTCIGNSIFTATLPLRVQSVTITAKQPNVPGNANAITVAVPKT